MVNGPRKREKKKKKLKIGPLIVHSQSIDQLPQTKGKKRWESQYGSTYLPTWKQKVKNKNLFMKLNGNTNTNSCESSDHSFLSSPFSNFEFFLIKITFKKETML